MFGKDNSQQVMGPGVGPTSMLSDGIRFRSRIGENILNQILSLFKK